MQPPFWLNAAPPIQEFGSTGMGRGAAFSQNGGCIYQFPKLNKEKKIDYINKLLQ